MPDSLAPSEDLTSADASPSVMVDAAVIGAGAAGLTAAFRLRRRGLRVRVFEAGPVAGGTVRTVRRQGFSIDCGPNTLLDTHPEVRDLLRDLDLLDRRIFPGMDATRRYVVRDGEPRELRMGPGLFFSSKLFPLGARLRLAAEPFVPRSRRAGPRPVEEESPSDGRPFETVADFVRRRLGPGFLDYAVDPFVGGIHAGDPERLLVKFAFPRLAEIERRYGSLIVGQILGARERKKRSDRPKTAARIYSFPEGVIELVSTLVTRMSDCIVYGARVTDIRREQNNFCVTAARHAPEGQSAIHCHARHVVHAAGLRDLSCLRTLDQDPPAPLRYPPVAVIALGYARERVDHPLDGFGVLAPSKEKRFVLGTLFSSTLFPGRAPEDHVLLTSFVGGDRRPDLVELDDGLLIDGVRADLADLLGTHGRPALTHVARWPAAIPQYDERYPAARDWMTRIESHNPGFFFAGNARAGISMPDTIRHAAHLADRLTTEPSRNHHDAA